MQLKYSNKKTETEIFNSIPDVILEQRNSSENPNLLIQANNLIALKQLITDYN